MNTPTAALCSLPLHTFSAFLPVSVWLSVSGFLFCPRIALCFPSPPPPPVSLSLSVNYSHLSAPDCESALLWQFCCRALLTCMSCRIAMSSHHSEVLRVCAVLPQQTWQCRTHAPSALWPGLPKEPPQANSTVLFTISAHSAPHNDGLQSTDSSHICLIIFCCQCWAFLI